MKLAFLTSGLQLFQDLLLYPLDTIATRVKSYKNKHITMFQEIKHIVSKEGGYAFYRGVSTSFPTTFVPAMVYFTAYEYLNFYGKRFLQEKQWANYTYLLPLATASMAESLAILFFLPFDIIRTRWQLNSLDYNYASVTEGLK